jgi:thiol-disulfide isomerase/thioredoxin
MKIKLPVLLVIASLLLSASIGCAAEKSDASAELKALVSKIQQKLRDGKDTEADLAPELKEFDALLAKHKGEKTDEAAQVLFMKAMLYEQVLRDTAKGDALLAQLKRDYPDSEQVQALKQQEESEKVRAGLVTGAKFPDFNVKDLDGKPLSVSNYKGKVVLLDFWATWCPPCRAELPNVIKTYDRYHKDGFEIIGISLDRDRDREKLVSFLKDKKMTWPQFFDGKYWQNELAVKYGVQSIPTTYLLDGQGVIIGKDLRGEALEKAVAKAVAKK